MTVTVLDWIALLPALIVMFTGFLVVGVDLFAPPRMHKGQLSVLSGVGLLTSAWLLIDRLRVGKKALQAFGGSIVLDDMACFLSLAVIAATLLLVVSAEVDTRRRHVSFGEWYGLLLLSASGMMLLVASNDFLTIFLNLEIVSLALYVLTGITRRNPRSNEAAVKYLVTGAFATALLLMGVAFLYGATGTISLTGIGRWLGAGNDSSLLVTGFALVLVGFAFKIGAAPFHMWVPDVYEGAPTTTTAFMSVTVKAAGVGALIRILLVAAPSRAELWSDLLWWMAVLTMVLGNLLALQQRSVKRMLAFSSVAHTGYVLVALATLVSTDGVLRVQGASSALFYLLSYTFMTLGAFVVLVYLGHEVPRKDGAIEWQDAETFEDLAGVARRRPWAAFAMTIFVISLGGIPPTAGFVGKFALFAAAVKQGHVAIALIGVTASLISLYYYLRVVVAMYMEAPIAEDEKPHRAVGTVVALAAVMTLLIGFLPGTLLDWANRSIDLLK